MNGRRPDWKVAGSLDQLLDQLDELAPRRSRRSDGSIGDVLHASRDSDHNPWWELAGQRYVTARDFTHDPRGGMSCQWLAESLQRGRDRRLKYVIWDRTIMSGDRGPSPWLWRPYSGSNPHEHHLHLSVVADARSLSRIPWQLTPREDDMEQHQADQLARIDATLQFGQEGVRPAGDIALALYRVQVQLDELTAEVRKLAQREA